MFNFSIFTKPLASLLLLGFLPLCAQYSHFPITHLDWKLIDFSQPSDLSSDSSSDRTVSYAPPHSPSVKTELLEYNINLANYFIPITIDCENSLTCEIDKFPQSPKSINSSKNDQITLHNTLTRTVNLAAKNHEFALIDLNASSIKYTELNQLFTRKNFSLQIDSLKNDQVLPSFDFIAQPWSLFFTLKTTNNGPKGETLLLYQNLYNYLPETKITNDLSRKNSQSYLSRLIDISDNPMTGPLIAFSDAHSSEDEITVYTDSSLLPAEPSSFHRSSSNRRAQDMANNSTYYWEMVDFDDTNASNDLFTFNGTNTSSYNITVEIAPLSSGSKGTANDDTAQGNGVWGKPLNSSNAWQNGTPSQSFNFMTIMATTNVIPVSNISVNSDAISYYLGNWWGHWDVTSSQNGVQTDYQLNYHFEFTGAPEPSTYVMTGALLCFIGLNGSSRKAAKNILKNTLRNLKIFTPKKKTPNFNITS